MKGRNDLLPSKKASWSPAASPPMTDSEFAKLMLEGGGRPRKGTFPSSIPFFSAKDQKNELPEPMATKAFPGIHPQQGGQVQDDEFAAWLSYPIDDYCSEILSELAGAEAMSAAAAPPLPSKPVQSKESPKPDINFSIFSRPIMESSSSPLKPPESPKIAASVSNPAAMKPDSEVLASSEKNPEPALASSSLCSQNEPKSRRREEDDETEEDQTEDQGEGESTDRRPAKRQATNKKRSRSAEIHNLSERRRRDRINEKMRALQELVPSCNKVDKASMLDEVIEYLKSLQMQLQAMSMGFMRPMMLPNGMPMNMGLGGGMGMVDMTGFPMMPFPAMNGMNGHPHGIHMMMPGHVMPMSMLHSPHFIPMRPPVAGTPIATPANPLQASIPCSEKSKVESFRDV